MSKHDPILPLPSERTVTVTLTESEFAALKQVLKREASAESSYPQITGGVPLGARLVRNTHTAFLRTDIPRKDIDGEMTTVMIPPGLSFLYGEDWDKLTKTHAFGSWVEQGIIHDMGVTDFGKLTDRDASELSQHPMQLPIARQWLSVEKRRHVRDRLISMIGATERQQEMVQ